MIFWFKKKKLVVDCFTWDEAAFKVYPVRKALPFYPDVIKKMPASVNMQDNQTNIDVPLATIKQCSGITGLYKHGAIIPFWTYYICQPKKYSEKNSAFGLSAGGKQPVEHPRVQYPGLFEDFVNVKITGIWNFVEPTGIKFIVMPTVYNLNNFNYNFIIPPAVSYFDLQSQCNLQLFVRKDSPDFTILAGIPILQIIPLVDSDREVEYKNHLVDVNEFTRKGDIPWSMPEVGTGVRNMRYRKLMDDNKKMDEIEKKSKCPFGFTK
jgi:hypothetical protein